MSCSARTWPRCAVPGSRCGWDATPLSSTPSVLASSAPRAAGALAAGWSAGSRETALLPRVAAN
eukprot:7467150-Pyramimonas_sp.AAC.1